MTTAELQSFIETQIPITKSLGVKIAEADARQATVKAPLIHNRNHLGTGFGGSLSTVLILAGYAWLFQLMSANGHRSQIVLRRNQVEYLHPVTEDLVAIAHAPNNEDVVRFFETFQRKGVARITVEATLETRSGPACLFRGDFIAKRADEAELI